MNLTSFVFAGLPVIIQQYADFYKQRDLGDTLRKLEPDFGLPQIEEYDFIVVGGGTAGSIVAGRLSDNFNVLLLELGGDPPPPVYPAYIASINSYHIRTHPSINEVYRSIPQSTSALDDHGIATVHAGRMLGGSGSHNSNVFNRGSPLDFDYWAKLLEDETWDYKHMLKHFTDTEDFVGRLVNEKDRNDYYGHHGPLGVTVDTPDFLSKWNMAALEILINDANQAYGVAYTRHGIPQIAHAKKEVIISAGAFGSPILLTKSGIGPRDVLQAAKVGTKIFS
ncbi:Oxygen-dependent choline dehydrogenase [Folsomia candida]|uniref:Oxygen-dependent choline dehydrogenase n=1 Tax=Folsomia candida TaxID=158441 RepID=A0A226DND3_FOLCA|nr:Oxygen-dependent choline dehydrogenase [Folsomia candida]